MLYHVVFLTVSPGRDEEAGRWLKALAEHSNRSNPRAVVEIIRRTDVQTGRYVWVGKLNSLTDHEEGGRIFQSDPQTQAMMKEGEELFTDREEQFYEIL